MKKTMTRVLSLVLVLAMFVSAVPLALADNIAISTVELTAPEGNIVPMGGTTAIRADVTPTNATESLLWTSDNEGVATVANGSVTPHAPGSALITAKSPTVATATASVRINVKYVPSLSTTTVTAVAGGDPVALPTVSVPGMQATDYTVTWTLPAETDVATVSGTSVTGGKAGTVTATATISGDSVNADDFTTTTLTCTVTVEEAPSYTPSIESTMTVAANESKALPTITGLDGLTVGTHYTATWSIKSGSDYISLEENNTKVKGKAVGSAVLSVTIAPIGDTNLEETTLDCTVTVTAPTSFVPKQEKASLELAYGSENALPTITGLNGLEQGADKDYTIAWTSSNESIVKVDGTKLKALAVGTAKLTATFAPKGGLTFNPVKLEWNVTVSAGVTLEVKDPIELTKGETYTLKKPTLKGENISGLYVDSFTYTRVSDSKVNTQVDTKFAIGQVLTGKETGRDSYIVTAVVKDRSGNEVKVPSITVYASVYAVNEDITAVVKDTVKSFTFDQENVLSSLKLGDTEVLSTYKSLENLLLHLNADHTADRAADHGSYEVLFSNDVSDGGKLVCSDQWGDYDITVKVPNMKYLVYVKFIKDENKVAKSSFDYKVVDDKGLAIMTGTLYIDYAGSSQISYATDFETPVTFKEEDFEKFWATYGTGKRLNYIKFSDLPSAIYGKLWTDENKTTAVNASTMLFAPDVSYGSAYYDLDTVTFVPAVRSAAYTITIPFTAVDIYSASVTGAVSITVSKGSKLTITNLGLRLGQTGAKLDDVIATDFKKATDETLDYLTFVLPEVEQGRLVYDFNRNYDTLLTAEDVLATDKLYYSPGSSEKVMDLADVWFFPAAGASGNIKLAYTAVGEGGAIYQGFITLNVSVKTKSQYFTDVKSGSYSWAADAVDFLRYHGVVNGTNADNTTFSPANSITRAHFMLMLYRAFLADDYADFDVTSNFPDIPKGTDAYSKELYQAVGVAKYLGITNGSDGKYLPNKNISREEAMTLIYRTLDILDLNLRYTSDNETRDFSDYNKVSAYAKDPLKYLIEHGVVLGTDGKINPKSNITRAEMAVILHRVLTY